MTGHSRWETVRQLPDPHGRAVQLAYVDGYLLALEDLLQDIKEKVTTDDLPGAAGFATAAILRQVRVIVADTMSRARATKKLLVEGKAVPFVCEACKEKKHLQCPGSTWCDCQHREDVGQS